MGVQRAQEEQDHSGMPRLYMCTETSDKMHKQDCQEMRKCDLGRVQGRLLQRVRDDPFPKTKPAPRSQTLVFPCRDRAPTGRAKIPQEDGSCSSCCGFARL